MVSTRNHGVIVAAGQTVTVDVTGMAGVGIQITGVWVGTVQFQGSVDGVVFNALTVFPTDSTSGVTSATSNGVWQAGVSLTSVQVLCSAWTSGYIVVSLTASTSAPAGGGGGGGGGGGDVVITDGVTTSIKATVKDYANSNPLTVVLVDTSGDAYVAGGGTGSSVDLTGINGVTPLVGNGVTGTGSLRVTIASNNTAFPVTTGGLTDTELRATPVPVSGTVTANAGTNLNTSLLALEAGGNLAAIAASASVLDDWDETDRAKVNIIVGQAGVAAGTGVDGATVQRVTLATNVALPTGSNVIGHVIADTGSTTAVTGNVTVVQSTASSLNATVVGAGSAGTANAGVVTVQGIASMTPVQVSQATAASLNAAVVGTGTAGSAAGGILTVQGVTSMTKLLVTPDSVALPANQSVNVAQMNGVATTMGSGNSGTGVQRVVIATDQPQLTNKLLVTPDANSAVNVAQVGGTNSVTAGVSGTLAVGGNVATNVAIGTNPINNGAQAISSENTAVTATRMAQLVCDLVGKLIVLPYSNPENFVSGAITSAMTSTTSTSLIAAPASGLRNYITQITVSNASVTIPTDIVIQDGSGGTTLYTVPCPIGTGTGTGTSGGTFVFPTPLRQPTTATAIFCANVTTGSSTKVSASGYKGA